MNKINFNAMEPVPAQGRTSKGNQPKWCVDERWYKADHMGYEGMAEVLVSTLLEKSNVPSFVRYEPVSIHYLGNDPAGCVSRNFRRKHEMLIPFERLHRVCNGRGLAEMIGKMASTQERICYTVNFVERETGLTGVGEYLTLLLELDAFFLNEDRHTNNIAVIRDEETMRFKLCPIFDNGLALLSDLNDYPAEKDMYDCIQHVHAKPFSTDFDEQAEAAESLYGAQLKLYFNHKDVVQALQPLAELYSTEILNRAERVVFEQMRKYQAYFC